MSRMSFAKEGKSALGWVFKVCLSLAFLIPFYVCVCFSFKSRVEIISTGLAFPRVFRLDNYIRGMEMSNFPLALWNTICTTVPSVIFIVFFSAMAAYIIARRPNRFFNFIYLFFMSSILLPFQAFMLPLTINLKAMGLLNSLWGFILAKVGVEVPFTTMLMTGFVKNVPAEIEEAAAVDGCNRFVVFWKIVLPMMSPIIVTSVVLNALYVWNEFQMALIMLQKQRLRTIPLLSFFFFSQNATEVNLAFAIFVLSMIPIIVLYLFMQKYIVAGITSGAVKG